MPGTDPDVGHDERRSLRTTTDSSGVPETTEVSIGNRLVAKIEGLGSECAVWFPHDGRIKALRLDGYELRCVERGRLLHDKGLGMLEETRAKEHPFQGCNCFSVVMDEYEHIPGPMIEVNVEGKYLGIVIGPMGAAIVNLFHVECGGKVSIDRAGFEFLLRGLERHFPHD